MRILRSKNIEIQHLWVITVILGVFVFINTQPIRPHDFWWHLALGREIVSTCSIPSVDVYSYTMFGTPYPSYQMFWLADIGLYGIHQIGGPALIIFFQSIIITASYAILLWLCWKESNSLRIAALATIFAVALGIFNWNVRPQTISYLIGAIFLLAIYSYRKRPRPRWLIVYPLGMLLWVNSHGSFVIGLVMIGIWMGSEIWGLLVARYRQEEILSLESFWVASAAFVATLIACLINPRGVGIVGYLQTLSNSVIVQNLIPEWSAPTFNDLYGIIFFVAFLLVAAVLALSPKRPDFLQLVTFLVFGSLGLYTTRGVVWFGIVMAPAVAYHVNAIVRSYSQNQGRKTARAGLDIVNLSFLLLLFFGAIISLPWFNHLLPLPQKKAGLISSETPLKATEILLSEKLPHQVFNEVGFGSYLIWAAQPEYKVFADPRIELFSGDVWRDYISLLNALPGWDEILKKHDINTIMVRPDGEQKFVELLEKSSGWWEIYRDEAAVIFTRKGNN